MTRAAEDRVIVLVRHGAAEQGNRSDADRVLTQRGHAEASEIGHWLAAHEIGADLVLCSPAARTRQTCEDVARSGCAETDVHHDRRLYNGSPDAILEVVREADPEASVVLVVGHAPGIPGLASLLADGEGSTEAHELMAEGFPTGSAAVLTYSGHWNDLAFADARLERFVVPQVRARS
jgi:phosphohistidine phosphatase